MPGLPKVAVVTVSPPRPPSTAMLIGSNVTVPGPRYSVHVTARPVLAATRALTTAWLVGLGLRARSRWNAASRGSDGGLLGGRGPGTPSSVTTAVRVRVSGSVTVRSCTPDSATAGCWLS